MRSLKRVRATLTERRLCAAARSAASTIRAQPGASLPGLRGQAAAWASTRDPGIAELAANSPHLRPADAELIVAAMFEPDHCRSGSRRARRAAWVRRLLSEQQLPARTGRNPCTHETVQVERRRCRTSRPAEMAPPAQSRQQGPRQRTRRNRGTLGVRGPAATIWVRCARWNSDLLASCARPTSAASRLTRCKSNKIDPPNDDGRITEAAPLFTAATHQRSKAMTGENDDCEPTHCDCRGGHRGCHHAPLRGWTTNQTILPENQERENA